MTGMLDQSFGAWLRERREHLDLTRVELARLAGCAPITLQKLEAGERRPSQQMAERLAGCLAIPERVRPSFVAAARRGAAPPFAALSAAPDPAESAIPLPLTPLIGRDVELAALRASLAQPRTRLVTLTGPAGVGKTHLALYLARSIGGAFRDGALFVDLEHVRQPEQLLPALARALELEDTGRPALVAALHNKHRLLVLDNFEQIVAAAAELAELLRACASPVALVTSREILHVRGEQPYTLHPLALPEGQDLPAVLDAPAVQLFATVAGIAAPAFRISAANAGDIAAICRRLDGLPLAIELVAPAVRRFPPAALFEQIEAALHLGAVGPRDLPDRQRTLRAALDWSYGMLEPAERACFTALGVFVDGASLEHIAAVLERSPWSVYGAGEREAAGRAATLATLGDLADKSLVQTVALADGEPRWRMLETMRLYALERLGEDGTLPAAREYHARTCFGFVEHARELLEGPEQDRWLQRLDREYRNVQAALDWFVEHDLPAAAQLTAWMTRYWFVRGYLQDGQSWIDRLIDRGDELPPDAHAKVLNAAGSIANARGDYEAGVAALEPCLALHRALDDATGISHALYNLSVAYVQLARYAEAQVCLEEALERDRAGAGAWDIAVTLGMLANLHHAQGDFEAALPLQEESLALLRGTGDDHSIALTLSNIAEIAFRRSDLPAAHRYMDEALGLARSLHFGRVLLHLLVRSADMAIYEHDPAAGAAYCREAVSLLEQIHDMNAALGLLLSCARLALYNRAFDRASMLLAAFETLRVAKRIMLPLPDLKDWEAFRAEARACLDEAAFAAAWQRGAEMDYEQAVAEMMNAE